MWKEVECENCYGSGEIICDRCGGAGSLPGFATFGGGFTACDVCYGSGYVPCHVCNGDGYIEIETDDDEYDEGYCEDRETREEVMQSSKQRILRIREAAFGIKTEIMNLYQSKESSTAEKYLYFKHYTQSPTVMNILNPNNLETFDDKEYVQGIKKYLLNTTDKLYDSLSNDVKSMVKKVQYKEEELKVENAKVFYRPFPPTEPTEPTFDEYTVQKPIKPVGYYKLNSKQKEQELILKKEVSQIGEKGFLPKFILFNVLLPAFFISIAPVVYFYWWLVAFLIVVWIFTGINNDVFWIAIGVYLTVLIGSVGYFWWQERKNIIAYNLRKERKKFYEYEKDLEKYTLYEKQLPLHKFRLKKYPDDLEKYKSKLNKYNVDLKKYQDNLEKHKVITDTLNKEIEILYKNIKNS